MDRAPALCHQIGMLTGALSGLQHSGLGDSGELKGLMQQIEQLHGRLQELQLEERAAGSSESMGTRQELVQCRVELSRCMELLTQQQDQAAEQYRRVLGDGKPAFEQLSHEEQMREAPEAAALRQQYQELKQVGRQVQRLNEGLMDAGYRLDRAYEATSSSGAAEVVDAGGDVEIPPFS
ncbi:hypothetical protein ACH6EH_13885 [Paenibacillus sp. JSM ZJ436]|uniref:hypothetical protein n=1 Tax=Paenibacillus sp. JSM ZJ436 TaxID=3376190 RepID=UPI0037BD5F5A